MNKPIGLLELALVTTALIISTIGAANDIADLERRIIVLEQSAHDQDH